MAGTQTESSNAARARMPWAVAPYPRQAADDDAPSTEELLTELAEAGCAAEAEPIRAEVVRRHEHIARREARRYRNRGEPLEDLYQVAVLGLMRAIEGYDPRFGKPFISYLMPTMCGELKRHFRDHTWAVRVPRKYQELRTELNRMTLEFAQANGRSPTLVETAHELGLAVETTVELLDAAAQYRALSLDAPHGGSDDDTDSLGDTIAYTDRALEGVVDRIALKEALAQLPSRERRILLLRFFGDKTQAQIGASMGLSQMHVSRLLSQTLERLRDHMRERS
ncbi:SigB/SigF/SigG family RNA polymerase sigma factor [Nocardiopsis ansamitocini]|uniref:RNA polymerase sigma-B factor n=1 Tax=Nocardiopsis ansamitocini TaxID=1670832 RepID=A0A9W6P7U4_9ACTN|nr:SigB/SigF/SigG family RNA polymerase sigma factor [Nocardiopsis ansamitocini]GLU48621.1 hypothetical protein Nans01_29720 [Nocardiopsis ansamitocini]